MMDDGILFPNAYKVYFVRLMTNISDRTDWKINHAMQEVKIMFGPFPGDAVSVMEPYGDEESFHAKKPMSEASQQRSPIKRHIQTLHPGQLNQFNSARRSVAQETWRLC